MPCYVCKDMGRDITQAFRSNMFPRRKILNELKLPTNTIKIFSQHTRSRANHSADYEDSHNKKYVRNTCVYIFIATVEVSLPKPIYKGFQPQIFTESEDFTATFLVTSPNLR